MAATLAKAVGVDKNGRVKEVTRLGNWYAEAYAQTYRTSVKVTVSADGSVVGKVERNGKVIHEFSFGPEES